MNRPFLFMAGEFRVTMPLVFSNDLWSHTMSARTLELRENGKLKRKIINEELEGVIYYASVEDITIRHNNLKVIIDNDIPCWPDPKVLLSLDDRFTVLKMCVDAGLVSHPVFFLSWEKRLEHCLSLPYVLKVGNHHRGEGKFMIHGTKLEEFPEWEGIASTEPYFMGGVSARALFIGEHEFAIRFDNETSWIKNSSGAEASLWVDAPATMFEHARKVRDFFGLEVCGIDYVVEKDGTPRFLEYNQFPGVDVDDSITPIVTQFFTNKMKEVEEKAKRRYTTVPI